MAEYSVPACNLSDVKALLFSALAVVVGGHPVLSAIPIDEVEDTANWVRLVGRRPRCGAGRPYRDRLYGGPGATVGGLTQQAIHPPGRPPGGPVLATGACPRPGGRGGDHHFLAGVCIPSRGR
jgi:hypothetical protein